MLDGGDKKMNPGDKIDFIDQQEKNYKSTWHGCSRRARVAEKI